MTKYEIYDLATGETVRTATEDDPRIRPIVPDGCGLRLAPEPPAETAAEPPPADASSHDESAHSAAE